MAKRDKHVDNLLDALVWMRRKAKRRQPVDELVDALIKMRRKTKKKLAQRKTTSKTRVKSRS
jgi:ClpP class serine protease